MLKVNFMHFLNFTSKQAVHVASVDKVCHGVVMS